MAWQWLKKLSGKLAAESERKAACPVPFGADGIAAAPLPRDVPDLEKLRKFSELGEKDPTPFYAGRENLIRRILRSAANAGELHRESGKSAGRTWVVQGAPGAGKSCLLEEMGKDPVSRGCEPWDGLLPGVLIVPRTMLADEPKLVKRIAEKVLDGADGRYRKTVGRGAAARGGFQFGECFNASFQAGRRTVAPPPDATLESLEKLDRECWERPLILAFDEIQNVTAEALPALEKLHLGDHRLPLVPVCGGLSNARDVLEGIGLTRIDPKKVVTLERLLEEEAEHAVRRMLEECGVKNRSGWTFLGRMAAEAEGWPQHLHNGVVVLAEEIMKADGDLARVDAGKVFKRAALSRKRSHRNRRTAEMKMHPVYVARVISESRKGRGMKVNEILVLMGRISKEGEREDERLPEGTSAKELLLEHLVKVGALQENEEEEFFCPIPCFSTFLVEAGGSRGKESVLGSPEEGKLSGE